MIMTDAESWLGFDPREKYEGSAYLLARSACQADCGMRVVVSVEMVSATSLLATE